LEAFVRGIQFDSLIACYLIALPLLVWSVFFIANKPIKPLVIPTNSYIIVTHCILFAVYALDIRYFTYFFAHIDNGAFGWLKFVDTTAGMIFQDVSNYIFISIFLVAILAFSSLVVKLGRKLKKDLRRQTNQDIKLAIKIPTVLFLFGLCFLGIRGTFQRYPLKVSYAYFSTNSFFNQLPVNSAFYLLKSYQRSLKQCNNVNGLMDLQTAITLAGKSLGVGMSGKDSLFQRQIIPEDVPIRPNVVIVLMESMSKANLSLKYKGKSLTPYLNELIDSSYFFENFYSAGVHTNNGIVATLYSTPTQFNIPMMQDTRIPCYGGLPKELQRIGYNTLFFITGNPQYDAMNSFLRENNISQIFSLNDYPEEMVVNNFGVQDDYMLKFGVDKLSQVSKTGQPFFATFLTVSNHDPIVLPEKFRHAGANPKESIIAYADNAIREFMDKAKTQKWFSNTIFLFLGDHGANVGEQKYEMPLSYNHIPLIIYSPLLKDSPKRLTQLGGQIDVFPTVMGLLRQPYTNHTLGVDLLKEKRPCMFFVNDTQLGCIDKNYLYVRNLLTNKDLLFDLHAEEAKNLSSAKHSQVKALKEYSVSMTVVGDYFSRTNVLSHATNR
jgi:phosphoglycerol transferase MdoB-like AlkP superfamily enzyme